MNFKKEAEALVTKVAVYPRSIKVEHTQQALKKVRAEMAKECLAIVNRMVSPPAKIFVMDDIQALIDKEASDA